MSICKMQVEDRKTGEASEVVWAGKNKSWGEIANEFERRNKDKRVILMEGIGEVKARSLKTSTKKDREIIQRALTQFAENEQDWFEGTAPPDGDAFDSSQAAIEILQRISGY